MADQTKYKIKISGSRTLGPLDFERVKALVMKGKILGKEPTATEPFYQWKAFSSFPELGQLLLEKLQQEGASRPQTSVSTTSEPTKTMAQTSAIGENNKVVSDQDSDEPIGASLSMPTLVDIDVRELQKPPANPDLEKTSVGITREERETDPDATKIISLDLIQKVMTRYAEPDKSTEDEATSPETAAATQKKRIFSPVFSIFITAALLAFIFLSDEEPNAPQKTLSPRYFRFPYVEVNAPPPAKNTNADQARELLEKGQELMNRESPLSYINAIKQYLYKAVALNPKDVDARATLAMAYLQLAEILPKDEKLFKSVSDLLNIKLPNGVVIPSLVAAQAEFNTLLYKQDAAEELLDSAISTRPTPEILYQKAKIQAGRGKLDAALATMNRLITSVGANEMNPRHATLQASLLDRKNQRASAERVLKKTVDKSPQYVPARILLADMFLKSGKFKEALDTISWVIQNPKYTDNLRLAESFLIAALGLEGTNQTAKAITFAESAKNIMPLKTESEDILFRLKSKYKKTAAIYSHVLAGRQREKAREYNLAIPEYIQASDASTVDPMPHILLGRILEAEGDIPGALSRYERATNSVKKPIEPLLYLAKIYLDRYQFDEAEKALRRAASLKRQSADILFLRGLLLEKQGQADLGEHTMKQAVKKSSRNPDLFTKLGSIEEERNNHQLAEFYYAMALRYDPQNAQAMLGVAMARYHLDSPSRAISFLKDRLNEQPNSAAIMVNLAVLYIKSGDKDAGKNLLQNAARSDKKYARAWKLLGDLTREEGDRQRGNFLARKESYSFAIASYTYYSKLAPNDPDGYKAVGDLYFEIRDLGAAAKNYYQVLKLVPNYPNVRVRLAQISENGLDYDNAMKLLEAELKINPLSDAAKLEQGHIYRAKGEVASALKAYTEAAQLNENNAEALVGIGHIHQIQGSYDNALSLYERVVKIDPLNDEVHWLMGAIYERKSDRVKAIQAYKNFLALNNEPTRRAAAQNKITSLEQQLHR